MDRINFVTFIQKNVVWSWFRKIFWRRECLTFQYSCLENSMDRGAWCLVGYSSWDHKESDTTKQLRHTHTLYQGHTCLALPLCKISSILTLCLPVSIRKDAFFYAITISLPPKATCVRVCLKPKQENQTHHSSRIQGLALSQAMYMFLGNPYCFHRQWNDTFPIKKKTYRYKHKYR